MTSDEIIAMAEKFQAELATRHDVHKRLENRMRSCVERLECLSLAEPAVGDELQQVAELPYAWPRHGRITIR